MTANDQQLAIDGPAASGKSTIAQALAQRLNACYINTGEMYRTLTWVVLDRGIDPAADPDAVVAALDTIDIAYKPRGESGELRLMLNDAPVETATIRAPAVTAQVSTVAKIGPVRAWMVERQRASSAYGLVVMEGRDIGTVVLPRARHKFFITASPLERARRRLAQSHENVDGATLQSVAAEIAERDRIDSTRAESPLRPADDAVVIDTTELAVDEVIDRIVTVVEGRLGRSGG